MSQIPSGLPASAAQANIQANEVAKERDARRTGQVDAARRQVQQINDSGTTIDTEDKDVAVFSDAEGTGSQGRQQGEVEEDASPDNSDDEKKSDGIRRDEDGQLHVDLEA